jgi:uncharacterized membrane protein YoaK (UPF0700 family)
MVRRTLYAIAARERTDKADTHLGVTLAFIAGAINAGGFLAAGRYTSHMTGIVSSIGDALALHQVEIAIASLLFLIAFISGAFLSSLIVNFARARHYHSEYASALMLEALLLLFFGVSATGLVPEMTLSLHITIVLLCFIMGLQNALISKISHSRIRTTHVTGIATDIGIELGRRLFRWLGQPDLPVHADRLLIPVYLLLSFLLGSIAGAVAFTRMGFVTVIPLSILLVVLAITPIYKDLHPLYRKQR